MIIELMIMLIVVGAGIVLVAWFNTRRRRQDALERREVEDSTTKLKKELERTATEIIGRMEKHVAHLEGILDESERNRTQLEGRVSELKKLLKKSEGQAVEIRDLLARLEDAGAEVDAMQRKMETLERRLNLVMSTPIPIQQPIQQPIRQPIQQPVQIPMMTQPIINPMMTQPINSPPRQQMAPPAAPNVQMSMAPPSPPPIKPAPNVQMQMAPPAPPPVARTPPKVEPPQIEVKPQKAEPPQIELKQPDKNFERVLEESIAAPPKVEERPPVREAKILSSESKQPVKVIEADPVKIEATRKRLTEASAEMAANPPEDISELEENQTADLKKKRAKRTKRDVRKAAIEAIKALEKQGDAKPPVAETVRVAAPEKLKPPERREQVPERRDLKLETTDSSIIKEMLLAGMTIEEIARETGLGRGAIELIQEMTRRQLDRK